MKFHFLALFLRGLYKGCSRMVVPDGILSLQPHIRRTARMTSAEILRAGGLWQEIEQGLEYAMRAHYAEATTLFLKVRGQASHIQPLAVLIDAFLSSHTR